MIIFVVLDHHQKKGWQKKDDHQKREVSLNKNRKNSEQEIGDTREEKRREEVRRREGLGRKDNEKCKMLITDGTSSPVFFFSINAVAIARRLSILVPFDSNVEKVCVCT